MGRGGGVLCVVSWDDDVAVGNGGDEDGGGGKEEVETEVDVVVDVDVDVDDVVFNDVGADEKVEVAVIKGSDLESGLEIVVDCLRVFSGGKAR